jgi:hypothetical protein
LLDIDTWDGELFHLTESFDNGTAHFEIIDENGDKVLEFGVGDVADLYETIEDFDEKFEYRGYNAFPEGEVKNVYLSIDENKGGIFTLSLESDEVPKATDFTYSTGSIGTVSTITKYAEEIEKLLSGNIPATIFSTDSNVENVSEFALEKHLEDFLVKNWNQTDLGKEFDIYQEDGELVGQQYPSDTGPIDILAISKDKKTLLVVELKKGRVSDTVVGQIQRYMGYVKDELAEPNQIVKGIIIGSEDDNKIRRALSVTVNIEFYRYQVSFKLFPNSN